MFLCTSPWVGYNVLRRWYAKERVEGFRGLIRCKLVMKRYEEENEVSPQFKIEPKQRRVYQQSYKPNQTNTPYTLDIYPQSPRWPLDPNHKDKEKRSKHLLEYPKHARSGSCTRLFTHTFLRDVRDATEREFFPEQIKRPGSWLCFSRLCSAELRRGIWILDGLC